MAERLLDEKFNYLKSIVDFAANLSRTNVDNAPEEPVQEKILHELGYSWEERWGPAKKLIREGGSVEEYLATEVSYRIDYVGAMLDLARKKREYQEKITSDSQQSKEQL